MRHAGGAEGFCDRAEWAETKEGWLRTFLDLPGGIPSHDTFERVFRRLNPKELPACFLRWIESLVGSGGQHVAIDGKTLRRSFDGAGGPHALHVVSAFATDGLGLVLGQVAVEDKSNEITAIPELLRLLDLKGAVVTIDAMGCHKAIAAQIIFPGRRLPARAQRQPPRALRGCGATLWRRRHAGGAKTHAR